MAAEATAGNGFTQGAGGGPAVSAPELQQTASSREVLPSVLASRASGALVPGGRTAGYPASGAG